eukprot:TRINITY_DN4156_c0_g1_i5.p2 TRINITY_DN4156_c0_g1~~TRINITY_DN4156_c0_g1_i5.p2  ORF type:complete len:788 (-),score=209.63 TRINITY_DN4156_c0_g1_i5:77-2440(-)
MTPPQQHRRRHKHRSSRRRQLTEPVGQAQALLRCAATRAEFTDAAAKIVIAQAVARGWVVRHRIAKQRLRIQARNDVARELLSTEQTYREMLGALTKLFLEPVAQRMPEELRRVFADLSIIASYSTFLLTKLETRMQNWEQQRHKIGDIFIKFCSFLKIYSTYVSNYEKTFRLTNQCIEHDPEIARHWEETRQNPQCKGLDIHSFLILPIQRLPRYVLLLTDLLRRTPEDHEDFSDLSKALHETRSVAEFVNQKKREAENMTEVYNIQQVLSGTPEDLTAPHRRFVKRGMLFERLEDKPLVFYGRAVFLFNDLLILSAPKSEITSTIKCKKGKKPDTDAMNEVLVNESKSYRFTSMLFLRNSYIVDNTDNEENGVYYFTLKSPSTGRSLQLCFVTGEDKFNWMCELDECIQTLTDQDRSRIFTKQERREVPQLKFDATPPDFVGKLDVQSSQSWKQRSVCLTPLCIFWFLKGGGNSTYDSISSKVTVLDLREISAHVVRVSQRPNTFQLTTSGRIFFLAATDGPLMFEWIFRIRSAVWKLFLKEEAGGKEPPPPTAEEIVASLTKQPTNSVCAECSSPDINSASLNLGVFLCAQCAAIHRGLPGERSKVMALGALVEAPVTALQTLMNSDNHKVNSELEAKLPESIKKPCPPDSLQVKRRYIQAKYGCPTGRKKYRLTPDERGVYKEADVLWRKTARSTHPRRIHLALYKGHLTYKKRNKVKSIDVTLCTPQRVDGSRTQLEVVTPTRVLYFSFTDVAEVEEWLKAINFVKKVVRIATAAADAKKHV